MINAYYLELNKCLLQYSRLKNLRIAASVMLSPVC